MPELRTLPDPELERYEWRMNGFQLEFRWTGFALFDVSPGGWHPYDHHTLGSIGERTPARLAVWRNLFLNPTDA